MIATRLYCWFLSNLHLYIALLQRKFIQAVLKLLLFKINYNVLTY